MKSRSNYETKAQQAKAQLRRHHDDGQAAFFDPAADPRFIADLQRKRYA